MWGDQTMTDKVQKIKQWIGNQRNEYNKIYEITHSDDLESHIAYANKSLLDRLLQFIDSLPEEPASEDLEEELTKYIESKFTIDKEQLDRFGIKPEDYTFSLDKEDMLNFAQHFAEWQRKKDQETIELAEDHAMLAGMMKEREEMMKSAVEVEVEGGSFIRGLGYKGELKKGDKVKIIIIKPEQQ